MEPYHPEIMQALAAQAGTEKPPPAPPVGDWKARRALTEQRFAVFDEAVRRSPDVEIDALSCRARDGHVVPLRRYRSTKADTGAAILYLHGGGMFMCSVDHYDGICHRYAAESGLTVIAVEFRNPPEDPYPTTIEDCYAALEYCASHADELGIDAARLGVAGDSGGGGLAAALALVARDRGGPKIAAQLLVYPMLDDRTTIPDPALAPIATWSYEDNQTAWGVVLGDAAGGPAVPPYAAPARAEDLAGLPRTYIEVGSLDIYRREDVEYAARLAEAGVDVELHVLARLPHGFDLFAPEAPVTRAALEGRHRFLRAATA